MRSCGAGPPRGSARLRCYRGGGSRAREYGKACEAHRPAGAAALVAAGVGADEHRRAVRRGGVGERRPRRVREGGHERLRGRSWPQSDHLRARGGLDGERTEGESASGACGRHVAAAAAPARLGIEDDVALLVAGLGRRLKRLRVPGAAQARAPLSRRALHTDCTGRLREEGGAAAAPARRDLDLARGGLQGVCLRLHRVRQRLERTLRRFELPGPLARFLWAGKRARSGAGGGVRGCPCRRTDANRPPAPQRAARARRYSGETRPKGDKDVRRVRLHGACRIMRVTHSHNSPGDTELLHWTGAVDRGFQAPQGRTCNRNCEGPGGSAALTVQRLREHLGPLKPHAVLGLGVVGHLCARRAGSPLLDAPAVEGPASADASAVQGHAAQHQQTEEPAGRLAGRGILRGARAVQLQGSRTAAPLDTAPSGACGAERSASKPSLTLVW